MAGFFEGPAGLKRRHPESGTDEIESARTIVGKIEFLRTEDLDALRVRFSRREKFELIPGNVVEETPPPLIFRGFEEIEVEPRNTFAGDYRHTSTYPSG